MVKYAIKEEAMPRQKHIALVAHDNKKNNIIEWCKKNSHILKEHFLFGTGTTAGLIAHETGLPINRYKSGPLGGDLQIGARIAEGKINMLIFFWDPLEAQPHDPDVKALLRISALYDIPLATNQATADFMLTSEYMHSEYIHHIVDYDRLMQERLDEISQVNRTSDK